LYFRFLRPNVVVHNKLNTIRILRQTLGYSQEYVAQKLNLTQQAYSKIERNPEMATLKKMREISLILGINVKSILFDEDFFLDHNIPPPTARIIHFTGLADCERTAFIAQIESLQNQVKVLTKIIEQKL
jgi:transcriptional regulator with XRE-family HTH domain